MLKDIKKLNDGVCNTYTNFIWEPILVKQNALAAATEVFFYLQKNFINYPKFISLF
jgi:hypothetical protein